MKQIKSFTVKLVAGANIATVIAMLLIGYSDRFLSHHIRNLTFSFVTPVSTYNCFNHFILHSLPQAAVETHI